MGIFQQFAVDTFTVLLKLMAGGAEIGATKQIEAFDRTVGGLHFGVRTVSPMTTDVTSGTIDAAQQTPAF